MWPPHFKLEHATRSHLLDLPRYLTSTSDECEPRSSILLDANENSFGSPFGKAIDALQGAAASTLGRLPSCFPSELQSDPGFGVTPSSVGDGALVTPRNALKRPLDVNDLTTLNKRQCYDLQEGSHTRDDTTPSTRTSREASADPSNADSASSVSSREPNNIALEDLIGLDALKALHRYPSTAQLQLRHRIAEWKGISDIKSICLGVGAAELIDAVIRLTCTPSRDAILTTPPTFGLYHVRALVNDVGVVANPLRLQNDDFVLCIPELLQKIAANPQIKLIFLASPGNPTGTLISLCDIRQILSCPDFHGLLVIDEAYIDFSDTPTTSSAMNLLTEFANLIVLQTTSKTLGLAGLRLGMAFGHPRVMQHLQKIQTPYCISTPAAALALRALSPSFAKRREDALTALRTNRRTLLQHLIELRVRGIDIGAPLGGFNGNFVTVPILARSEDGTRWQRDNERAKGVTDRLKAKYSIAIRYVGDLQGCEGCVRVTVGTDAENKALCEALRTILSSDYTI